MPNVQQAQGHHQRAARKIQQRQQMMRKIANMRKLRQQAANNRARQNQRAQQQARRQNQRAQQQRRRQRIIRNKPKSYSNQHWPGRKPNRTNIQRMAFKYHKGGGFEKNGTFYIPSVKADKEGVWYYYKPDILMFNMLNNLLQK